MEREIDIDNEKQILKECDFDYLYNSKKCSRELCMFYNDIILSANKMQGEYDVNRAFIDLGRIAIVLNKQSARIKELEEENQQLKQAQKQLAIFELVKLRKQFLDMFLFPTFDALSPFIDEQIKKLMGEK